MSLDVMAEGAKRIAELAKEINAACAANDIANGTAINTSRIKLIDIGM